MLCDPIADFLTRIRNAQKQRHRYVDIPLSKEKVRMAKVMREEGFIKELLVDENKRTLRLLLGYASDRTPLIRGLKRVSKPGLRRYISYRDIPEILGKTGTVVMSTNRGIINGETARAQKLGGEVICYIW